MRLVIHVVLIVIVVNLALKSGRPNFAYTRDTLN